MLLSDGLHNPESAWKMKGRSREYAYIRGTRSNPEQQLCKMPPKSKYRIGQQKPQKLGGTGRPSMALQRNHTKSCVPLIKLTL
jgi:hypothetical protein